MTPLVLVVEDEPDLRGTIEYNLALEGFQTKGAQGGEEAIELATSEPYPDIILLDIMLPDISGIEVCRRIRDNVKVSNVPIIMVTARGEEIDRIVGFEMGADDYIVKPFSVRELMLRIKALMKRSRSQEKLGDKIRFGILTIDEPAHRVRVNNRDVELTALEFRLLSTLYTRRGRVQTRDMLLNDVWGIDSEVTTRTVDTHIKRLREKIAPAGGYIETIRGVGYRFKSEPGDEED